MTKLQFALMIILPALNSAGMIARNMDSNRTGKDDKFATFCEYAVKALTAIANDAPVPALPDEIKAV